MTRIGRRKTGGSKVGLFRWGPYGDVPDELDDNPLLRPCGFCAAAPRQHCRRPVRGGWAEMPGRFHDSRTADAAIKPDTPETGPQRPTEPRTEPQ